MEETARTGIPLMRPMFLEFPQDQTLGTNDSEFMFGADLLVAPKVVESVGRYEVRLPDGVWYDFWTGKQAQGRTQTVDPPLGTLPVYVRGGTILPEQPVVQNSDEVPQGPLQVSVYPGPNCAGSLYQDDGNTMAYKSGKFLRIDFTCDSGPTSLRLKFVTVHGVYKPWWSSLKIVFFGVGSTPREVSVNHVAMSDWGLDPSAQTVTVTLQAPQPDGEVLMNQ
jgi:alpha-glucosidase